MWVIVRILTPEDIPLSKNAKM